MNTINFRDLEKSGMTRQQLMPAKKVLIHFKDGRPLSFYCGWFLNVAYLVGMTVGAIGTAAGFFIVGIFL